MNDAVTTKASASPSLSPRSPGIRILVITSVPAERDAVSHGLQGDSRFDVIVAGVGTAAAAARTASAMAAAEYGLVVNAGIGGGKRARIFIIEIWKKQADHSYCGTQ